MACLRNCANSLDCAEGSTGFLGTPTTARATSSHIAVTAALSTELGSRCQACHIQKTASASGSAYPLAGPIDRVSRPSRPRWVIARPQLAASRYTERRSSGSSARWRIVTSSAARGWRRACCTERRVQHQKNMAHARGRQWDERGSARAWSRKARLSGGREITGRSSMPADERLGSKRAPSERSPQDADQPTGGVPWPGPWPHRRPTPAGPAAADPARSGSCRSARGARSRGAEPARWEPSPTPRRRPRRG